MKQALVLLFCVSFTYSFAQNLFYNAYLQNQLVPSGLLESVAWNNTRMQHLENIQEGCSGIPTPYGIMGLHDDGKNYFIKNGETVSSLSGISIDAQKASPENQILAFAKACQALLVIEGVVNARSIRNVLHQLSEIPDSGIVNLLAKDMQVYSVLKSMNDPSFAFEYSFTPHNYDLESLFGEENYKVLSSPKVEFTPSEIKGIDNAKYSINAEKSTEFGPAVWNPAPTCNYSSRSGVAVSAITIHTIQGSYAGAISWSQNCSSNVSYHYVIRSSDGQITQMVSEANKAWHVGSENPYTIGYEHEGYVNDPAWYTDTLYGSSAAISRDVVNSGYGIPALRTFYGEATVGTNLLGGCTKIKGHQHFPNQSHTDPGVNWDWEKYYRLINNNPTVNLITSTSGAFFDTGGAGSNYQDDEREIWVFEPANTQSVSLEFTAFNIESGFDKLFIYDGNSIEAPLIGSFTGTNSPGIINSTGGSLTVEFRSDCGTVSDGWEANFLSTPSATPPTTSFLSSLLWQTNNFQVNFNDQDVDNDIRDRFYLVAEKNIPQNTWSSNGAFGFVHETFDSNSANWTNINGVFTEGNGVFNFSDFTNENSNSSINVVQSDSGSYLYSWTQTITSSESNQRAGMHFFCSDVNQTNRGDSYFVFLRESNNKAQIYAVKNNVFNLVSDVDYIINVGQAYKIKSIYNPSTGQISLYIDNQFVSSWTDATPLLSGSAISLRTAGCEAQFDDVKVFKSRSSQALVTAGPSMEMSVESINAVATGKIITTLVDEQELWSNLVEKEYMIDFSPPVVIELNDGTSTDVDTLLSTTIEANWSVEDIHSDIVSYQVAVGTLPNTANIIPWSNNGMSTVFSALLSNPIYNKVYHVSIVAYNGAGLNEVFLSDGQRFMGDLGIETNDLDNISLYPNPSSEFISLSNTPEKVELSIYDMKSRPCLNTSYTKDEKLNISTLSNGQYTVIIRYKNSVLLKKLVIRK